MMNHSEESKQIRKSWEKASFWAFAAALLIFTLFSALSVQAVYLADDTILHYSMNAGTGTTGALTDDTPNLIHGNLSNAKMWTTAGFLANGTNVTIQDVNMYGVIPTNRKLEFNGSTNFSINLWFKSNDAKAYQTFIGLRNESGVNQVVLQLLNGQLLAFTTKTLASETRLTYYTAATASNGSFHMYTLTHNATHDGVYFDGVLVNSNTTAQTANSPIAGSGIRHSGPWNIHKYPYGVTGCSAGCDLTNGTMDELAIFNKTLSQTDITWLYDSGSGINWSEYNTSTSSVALNSPTNNYHNFSSITYSYTPITLDSVTNCTINRNGTDINTDSLVVSGSTYKYTETLATQGAYSWYVSCVVGGGVVYPSSTYTFTIDSVPPEWTINSLSLTNTTIINTVYNRTWYFGDVCTDNNLFGWNLSIRNSTHLTFTNQTTSLTGTSVNIAQYVNMQNYSSGVYYVNWTCADSHTKNDIGAYNERLEPSKVEFKTEEGNTVSIESEDVSDSSTEKKKDRVSFSFEFQDSQTKRRTFHVRSDGEIYYLRDSEFKGHFVILKNGMSGNWLDFEGEESDIKVVYEGKGHYSVTFDDVGPRVTFESIGGLNEDYEQALYTVYNEPAQVENLTGTTSEEQINITWNDSVHTTNSLVYRGSTLVYNGSNNNFTDYSLVSGTPYTYTVYASYALDNTENRSVSSENHGVFTTLTNGSITFNFYDEMTDALINYRTVYLDLIIFDVISSNYSTSTGTIQVRNLTSGNYTFRYYAADYNTRFYFAELDTNATYSQNLTLLNSTEATNVTLKVYDEVGNPLEDARVKILKYDVATNSFILVEVSQTNFEGSAQASMILNDEYYIFVIEYAGATLFTSSPTYIFTDTLSFTVIIGGANFQNTLFAIGLKTNITQIDDSTFRFYWNDPGNQAKSGCLYAYRLSYNNKALYNSSCAAGATGAVTIGLDNTSGNTYELKGVVIDDASTAITRLVEYLRGKPDTGSFGYFLLFCLICLGAFISIYNLAIGVLITSFFPFLFSVTGLIGLSTALTIPIIGLGLLAAFIIARN